MPSGIIAAVAAFLFVAIFLLRLADRGAEDAMLVLFVLPIALCAIEFGVRGGLAAAFVALALLAGWEAMSHSDLKPLGVATRTTAYFLLGGLLGRFVDERGALQAELARHYDLSRDLFCTARFDGRFERLNQAWQTTLGYTEGEPCSRPFVDFVHPDDRERTRAETAKLAE